MARLSRFVAIALVLSLLAFWTAQARAAEVVRGNITSVATEEYEFTMTDLTGKEWRFQLGADAAIRACDRATIEELLTPDSKVRWDALLQMFLGGKRFAPKPEMALGALRQGDSVIVTYTTNDRQLIALEVCVTGFSVRE